MFGSGSENSVLFFSSLNGITQKVCNQLILTENDQDLNATVPVSSVLLLLLTGLN